MYKYIDTYVRSHFGSSLFSSLVGHDWCIEAPMLSGTWVTKNRECHCFAAMEYRVKESKTKKHCFAAMEYHCFTAMEWPRYCERGKSQGVKGRKQKNSASRQWSTVASHQWRNWVILSVGEGKEWRRGNPQNHCFAAMECHCFAAMEWLKCSERMEWLKCSERGRKQGVKGGKTKKNHCFAAMECHCFAAMEHHCFAAMEWLKYSERGRGQGVKERNTKKRKQTKKRYCMSVAFLAQAN